MPLVSRWLVRASLVSLLLGFTLGAVMLFNKGVPLGVELGRWRPAHVELLLIGWVVQLTMGVATWILPRFGVRRSPHGSETAAWVAFTLLNAGVVAASLSPFSGPVLFLAGRTAEAAAAVVFVANVWARVRASGLSAM